MRKIRTDDNLNPLVTSGPAGRTAGRTCATPTASPQNGTATIAIVDAYGYTNAESDLKKYRENVQLAPVSAC